jgi:hypothetical protein
MAWPGGCTIAPRMSRYDRTWEPLVVLIAFAVIWIGTL